MLDIHGSLQLLNSSHVRERELPWSQIIPTSGLMEALSLIRPLAFLLLGLGSLHTSLSICGMIGGGVMLILFALRVMFRPVEVSVLFLGLFSLSKVLSCGESHSVVAVFWCCSFGC